VRGLLEGPRGGLTGPPLPVQVARPASAVGALPDRCAGGRTESTRPAKGDWTAIFYSRICRRMAGFFSMKQDDYHHLFDYF